MKGPSSAFGLGHDRTELISKYQPASAGASSNKTSKQMHKQSHRCPQPVFIIKYRNIINRPLPSKGADDYHDCFLCLDQDD